uniref:ethanolamine kinase n=2 Tax=Schistocephalus solidus TaxID=70667 RepID=A0A0X3PSE8_SCHSO
MLNLVKELSLSITGPADIPNIHLLISEIRPIWDLSSVQIKVFNEGTSNTLFAVYTGLDLSPENCLLVRIFGAQTELYIDRKHEAVYLWILHKLGFASEVFAKFTNGICYEYIPGFVPSYEFALEPNNYKMIAEKMAHLHALPIRATVERFLTETDFVVSEEACVLKHIHRYIELLPPDESPMPENFKAVNILENYGKHKHAYPSEYPSRADLLEEARFLKRILEGAKSPVAFCHNDLLLGNMLISPNQGTPNPPPSPSSTSISTFKPA